MEMVIPNGGSNPERDLHAAAFYSKVGAFAGVFQVLQNQRTNQLLEGQLLLQGQLHLRSQLNELKSYVQSSLDNHIESYSFLKTICQQASQTWLGEEVKEKIVKSFDELSRVALLKHEQLEEILEIVDEIQRPEEFADLHLRIENCAQENEKYSSLATNLGEKVSLILDYSASSNRMNETKNYCEELWDRIRDAWQNDEALLDRFEDQIERFENYPVKYNEEVSKINQCQEEFAQEWFSNNPEIIKDLYQSMNSAESVLLEQKEFLEEVHNRINRIKDGVVANSTRSSKSHEKKSAKTRMKELQALFDDGFISKSEYEEKREEILKSV